MNPAKNIIRKCGGAAVVARWLGVHQSRVYRWCCSREEGGTNGFVPARHQAALLERARAEGIDLNPEDFFSRD